MLSDAVTPVLPSLICTIDGVCSHVSGGILRCGTSPWLFSAEAQRDTVKEKKYVNPSLISSTSSKITSTLHYARFEPGGLFFWKLLPGNILHHISVFTEIAISVMVTIIIVAHTNFQILPSPVYKEIFLTVLRYLYTSYFVIFFNRFD